MATAGTCCWADLDSELVVSIATAACNGLSLRDYMSLRGVCTAWRSALALPYPCLLSLIDDRVSVFSLPTRRLSKVAYSNSTINNERRKMGILCHTLLAGSGNGRFAITLGCWIGDRFWTHKIFLVSPSTGDEVVILPPGTRGYAAVHKIVFAPSRDDGTVVAMHDQKEVSYIDTTSSTEDMKWTTIDVQPAHTEHFVDLVLDDAGGCKVLYCLDSRGGVRVLHIPRGLRNEQEGLGVIAVEPPQTVLSFPGTVVFASPYNFASAKNLFFCHGSLYQVWQNISVTVRLRNGSTMFADEIFVLRYNSGRWLYSWDKVKDLGGCSVFVGKNNSPVVARAGAVPGVQADCVYWIDWRGVPMVCDVATGSSKPCVLPYGAGTDNCWYFQVDDMTSIDSHRRQVGN